MTNQLNITGAVSRILRMASLLSFALLSACASFDGQQRAVIGPNLAMPAQFDPPSAIITYYGIADGEAQARFRDSVIGVYMTAIDASYTDFRRRLSRETKGANFGLGLGLIALTNGASIAAERTANVLSAGAAGLTGAQGALSKEVYFEKTLPALFAGMEANRIRVRATILRRMRETPGTSYSLTEAFADLASYEAAGSLESAIEMVTAEASERRAVEQARFDNQTRYIVGAPAEGVTDIVGPVRTKLEALSDTQLNQVATALGVTPSPRRVPTLLAIMHLFGPLTDLQATQDLAKKVDDAIGGLPK
jgi:hypothetical protein